MAKQLTKKVKIILIVVASVIFVGAVLGLVLGLTLPRREKITLDSIAVKQVGKDQRIKVEWETSGGSASKVDITVKKSNGLVDSAVTISNPSLLAKRSTTLDVSYGKNTVEVTVRNSRNSVKKTTTVDVYTDEYVIAPLVATMPVTLFSLQMEEITDNYTIPTFVWLQRGLAWNYNKMPDNVYLMPVASYEVMSGYLGDNYSDMYYKTSKWVGELYEINKDSKFHFYVNDYHPLAWLMCTYLNQMPTDNYDVTLLTDGTASNAVFESLFSTDSAVSDYNNMVTEYNNYKQDLWNKHNPDLYNNLITVPLENLKAQKWILPMLKEESNVRVILTRDYFASNDEKIDPTIKGYVNDLITAGKITKVGLYDLLNALGEDGKLFVKSLYKFGDNVFEKAAQEGKIPMVILGTRTTGEDDLEKHVKAVKAYYGETDYVYYYKGHPWTPTASDPAKAERLENMGLIDVDSSISAELLFFFNQDAVATGYGSTTYKSLNANQVGGVFNRTLETSLVSDSEHVKFVINEVSLTNNPYGSIASAGDMVFEFADTSKYNIAVYGKASDTIKYYKQQGSDFVEVSK